jgi:hypothetical protein
MKQIKVFLEDRDLCKMVKISIILKIKIEVVICGAPLTFIGLEI